MTLSNINTKCHGLKEGSPLLQNALYIINLSSLNLVLSFISFALI